MLMGSAAAATEEAAPLIEEDQQSTSAAAAASSSSAASPAPPMLAKQGSSFKVTAEEAAGLAELAAAGEADGDGGGDGAATAAMPGSRPDSGRRFLSDKLSPALKLTMHFLLVITLHWYVYFRVPAWSCDASNGLCEKSNLSPNGSDGCCTWQFGVTFFYLLCSIYLFLSARQLRVGLPLILRDRPMTDGGSGSALGVWLRLLVYKWSLNIPFLWEMQQVMDWTVETTVRTHTTRTQLLPPFPLTLSHTQTSPLLPPRPPSRADSRSTILHEHRRHLCRHHACTRQPLLAAVHKGKVSSSSTYTAAPLSPLTHSPLTTPLPTSNLQALSHTTEDTARRPLRCRSNPRYDRSIVLILLSKPDRPIE